MNPDLERLINMAKESGELTEKQKSIILRKAEELGEDIEEVEMVLETVKSKSVSKDSASEKKKKCPVCGAVVSYEARCPECGFAFDRIETSTSITNFFEELRLIHPRKYSQKKQVIESFPIPNSKKDLLDFIILMKPLASDPQNALKEQIHIFLMILISDPSSPVMMRLNNLRKKDTSKDGLQRISYCFYSFLYLLLLLLWHC